MMPPISGMPGIMPGAGGGPMGGGMMGQGMMGQGMMGQQQQPTNF